MDLGLLLNLATTAAVVGGVLFAAWQLRLAARTRATQICLHMMETLYSSEIVDGMMALWALPDGLPAEELRKRLAGHWSNAFATMVTFDGLGMLVYRRELPFRIADDFFRHSVSLVWEKVRTAADDIRAERRDERALEYLQWLAEQMGVERQQPAVPAYRSGLAVKR